MHVTDEQAVPLKAWLVQRLDDISDAESDVLADYVLALIKTDEPDTELRQRCITDLEEFLKDNTTRFVDDVIAAVKSGSYDPKHATAQQTSLAAGSAAALPIPSFDGSAVAFAPNSGSRKRSFNDDDTEMQDAGARGGQRGDRQSKYLRRGGFEQRGRGRGGMMAHGGGLPQLPQLPQLDPNDPMGAILAMQAMMSNMPGMEGMPGFNGIAEQQGRRPTGKRCFDYDNKGFCARGAACPYDHGTDHLVVAAGTDGGPSFAHNSRTHERGRGRGRGRADFRGGRGGGGGGDGRAPFSSPAPNNDRSITSVVVEKIPEEQFNEVAIRDFFGQFGEIEDLSLQAGRRLAIIKYADYSSAKSAYDSPKVIFDNRFVKVYWHKTEGSNGHVRRPQQNGSVKNDGDVDMGQGQGQAEAEAVVDPAELARKQEEAQKMHEERKEKRQAAEAQRAELEAKLKAQEAERAALMAKLTAKTGIASTQSAAVGGGSPMAAGAKDPAAQAKTDALRAKLAALEEDARRIGINPNEVGTSEYATRGRGGLRGRGRGRGQFRAGWRGRGAPFAARGGGSVMRLDNRPRTINVTLPKGTSMGSDADEALKQFLLFSNLMEAATVQPNPERSDAVLISFQQRYQAEQFLNAAVDDIPHVGKCELSWVPNASVPGAGAGAGNGNGSGNGDVNMDTRTDPSPVGQRVDVDYDVADDDDRWLAE